MTIQGLNEAKAELIEAMAHEARHAAIAGGVSMPPSCGAQERALRRYSDAIERTERAHAKLAAFAEIAKDEGVL